VWLLRSKAWRRQGRCSGSVHTVEQGGWVWAQPFFLDQGGDGISYGTNVRPSVASSLQYSYSAPRLLGDSSGSVGGD